MTTVTNMCRSERQPVKRELQQADLPPTWDTLTSYKKELYKFIYDFIGNNADATGIGDEIDFGIESFLNRRQMLQKQFI